VTERHRSLRVLVVDDAAEMQALISRALTAHGYQVDVASSLADARILGPGGYDSLVVDAHLGQDRGTDLVMELVSAEPGAAARCLVITGGAAGPLPDGVSVLAKPFHPADLLAAVQALRPHAQVTGGHPAGRQARQGLPAATPPASGPPPQRTEDTPQRGTVPQATVQQGTVPRETVPQDGWWPGPGEPGATPVTAGLPAGPMLAVVRGLRTQERGQLVDILHDGPIQDLAAVMLTLHLLRGPAVADLAVPLAGLRERLDSASRALRSLIDGQWPFLREETRLPEALAQRTAWLLTTPLTVHLRPADAAVPPPEVPGVVDLIELLLFTMAAGGPLAAAEVTVEVAERQITVQLTATPPDPPGLPATPGPDLAAGEAPPGHHPPGRALAGLGPALGVRVRTRFGPARWQAAVTVPR
jgi:CheY-like chemotaxis protein